MIGADLKHQVSTVFSFDTPLASADVAAPLLSDTVAVSDSSPAGACESADRLPFDHDR